MNVMQMISVLSQLMSKYSDPKMAIEEMLRSGQITQEQLDDAINQVKNLARGSK